jgi:hypothetical protein
MLTPKACALLKTKPPVFGRGSFVTQAATHYLFEACGAIKSVTWLKEGLFGGKQVDILGRHPNGAFCFEIAGNPNHEPANVLHNLRYGGSELLAHLVVAVDKKVEAEVLKKFSATPEISNDSRVGVVTLARALSPGWLQDFVKMATEAGTTTSG